MTQAISWRALPKFTWGTAYANTLEIARPFKEVKAYSLDRTGSQVTQARNGDVDGWLIGTDHWFEAIVQAIPVEDTLTEYGVTQTGWAGDTKWEGFLEWALQKFPIRFYPDRTLSTHQDVVFIEPWMNNGPSVSGWAFHRDQKIKLLSAVPFTGY